MELIKFQVGGGRCVLAAALLFCLALPLYTQESGSSTLAGEIETLRKTLQTPGISAAGTRDAAIRLARFLTLAGNLEEAADAWFTAAAAEPGKRDDMSLLAGVRCLIAMGQLDAAGEYVGNILLTGNIREGASGPGSAFREARYLGSQIQAIKTGNGEVLDAFLNSDEYTDKRPSMLYTLWHITGEEAYRNRLEAEYPSSPEARIIRDNSAGQVLGAPTAMWLLLPGREGVVLSDPVPAATDRPPEAQSRSVPASGEETASVPAAASSPAVPAGVILQTGLFSREANTAVMAERLKRAGFTALVTRRRVNGTDYWAVGVPPGENMNDTTLALKDAGFESFPVY